MDDDPQNSAIEEKVVFPEKWKEKVKYSLARIIYSLELRVAFVQTQTFGERPERKSLPTKEYLRVWKGTGVSKIIEEVLVFPNKWIIRKMMGN